MLSLSYEFFVKILKSQKLIDFIQILADIKYNQILSIDKNSFYPSKPGLQKLEEKYALFQSSMEDQKEVIKEYKLSKESSLQAMLPILLRQKINLLLVMIN